MTIACARRLPALLLAVLLALGGGTLAAAPPEGGDERYIVVLRDDQADVPAAADDHARRYGAGVAQVYEHALKGYAATIPAGRLAAVRRDPRVAFVEADRVLWAVGTVPLAGGDTAPTGVRRIEAATTTTAHQASTTNVAVIDTGIDLAHPDRNAANGKNCTTTKRNAPARDGHGHGTHVAGTIAARNSGAGVVGVAPGTKLYAVKVLSDQGWGFTSWIVCGIDWVTQNGAALNIQVANMSLGGGGTSEPARADCQYGDAQHKAICNSTKAGVTYVVAAGNDGADLAGFVPAAYPEVLTVTAMADSDGTPGGVGGAPPCRSGEQDDAYATFSNYARPDSADSAHPIAGPGVCIRSTWLSGDDHPISGTSMAAPHVAGTVALCLGNGGAAGPCAGLAPARIIARLRADAAAHATASNGFAGDPARPLAERYYGDLAWAGGY